MKFFYKHEGNLKVVELGDTEMTVEESIKFVKNELGLSDKTTVLGIVDKQNTDDMLTLKGND